MNDRVGQARAALDAARGVSRTTRAAAAAASYGFGDSRRARHTQRRLQCWQPLSSRTSLTRLLLRAGLMSNRCESWRRAALRRFAVEGRGTAPQLGQACRNTGTDCLEAGGQLAAQAGPHQERPAPAAQLPCVGPALLSQLTAVLPQSYLPRCLELCLCRWRADKCCRPLLSAVPVATACEFSGAATAGSVWCQCGAGPSELKEAEKRGQPESI